MAVTCSKMVDDLGCAPEGIAPDLLKGGIGSFFFRFPCGKLHPVKRAAWIRAVRRVDKSDPSKNWKPSQLSRLCSAHFITGKPALEKAHPDYVPTLFSYSRPRPSALGRFQRWSSRSSTQEAATSGEPSQRSSCPSVSEIDAESTDTASSCGDGEGISISLIY
ncbi:uncharacterized protein LOC120840500 [Ixodes scapularis]|uniref:uncharacterized protein LOC120840500 n=1 Tax=Ixodes scapularis TaxID=6945 RepID=UPI001A9E33B6|nr:uncharacterized protein LOC120840500 [Ixodes scapularis]